VRLKERKEGVNYGAEEPECIAKCAAWLIIISRLRRARMVCPIASSLPSSLLQLQGIIVKGNKIHLASFPPTTHNFPAHFSYYITDAHDFSTWDSWAWNSELCYRYIWLKGCKITIADKELVGSSNGKNRGITLSYLAFSKIELNIRSVFEAFFVKGKTAAGKLEKIHKNLKYTPQLIIY